MKATKCSLAIVLVMFLSLLFFSNAECCWLMNDGAEILMGDVLDEEMLDRVDDDTDAPLHEQDEGVYGFYDENEVWITVIDFGTSQGIVAPFTWDMVNWVPGPMDKGWEE
ncbi:hypothetical protein K9N50_03620 [bacterium]|nr:hypothetical protein [bacterium]